MSEEARVRVGLRLPTLLSQGLGAGGWAGLGHTARRAESQGFDALWCLDHILAAEYVFGSASLEPVVLLSYLAGCTENMLLGTSVLVAPLRDPFWLAKQLGTLSAVAGERVLLGLGAGWDEREFRTVGVDRAQRGTRLDHIVNLVETARRHGSVAIDGVPVEPPPSRFGSLLIGGGGSATVRESGTPVRLAPRVLARIARADGWLIRSSSPHAVYVEELRQIRAERLRLGRVSPFEVVRASFIHVSEERDDDRALAEQVASMERIGWRGSREDFTACYPHGSVAAMLRWFRAEVETGVTHFILHAVGDFERQAALIARHLLPELTRMTPRRGGSPVTPASS